MKVSPVSADLLIKLAFVLAGVGALGYVLYRVNNMATGALGAVGNGLQAVNPLNENNVLYHTANQVVQAATGSPNSLGTWLYEITHPEPATPNTGGATGSW